MPIAHPGALLAHKGYNISLQPLFHRRHWFCHSHNGQHSPSSFCVAPGPRPMCGRSHADTSKLRHHVILAIHQASTVQRLELALPWINNLTYEPCSSRVCLEADTDHTIRHSYQGTPVGRTFVIRIKPRMFIPPSKSSRAALTSGTGPSMPSPPGGRRPAA